MNLREAADYLRVSVRLIQKLVYAQRLRPGRIGRRLIFTQAELDRLVSVSVATGRAAW